MTAKRILFALLSLPVLWGAWKILLAANRPYHFDKNAFVISDVRTPDSNADMVSLTCPISTGRDRETCGCIRSAIYANTTMFERYLFTYGNSWLTGYSVWQGGRNAGLSTDQIRELSERVNRLVPELSRQCDLERQKSLKN